VITSFIFGTDNDTEASFDSAFDFFDRNDILYPYFNILTPTADQWKRYLAEGRILTVKAKLYDAHHTVFVPMKMTPRQLQEGFIRLVDRTFDYANITKRMMNVYVNAPLREVKLAMPRWLERAAYRKIHWTLSCLDDLDSLRFLEGLKPYIFDGRIPMASVLLQIDQHDWAVHNRDTIREHRYSLDVPCWKDREPTAVHEDGGLAAEIAAHVR
jgi:hypothetical protein